MTIETQYERHKREDAERWEEYQRTGEAIPHEEVAAWLEKLARGEDIAWSIKKLPEALA